MSMTLPDAVRMKIETILDHRSIQAQREGAIFFGVRFIAEASAASVAPPAAYCLVVDLSAPSAAVLAQEFIRHLPTNADMGIVVFGETAEVVHEMGGIADKGALQSFIASLEPAPATGDLSAAWMLARNEMRRASHSKRKIIFLTNRKQPGEMSDENSLKSLALQASEEGIAVSEVNLAYSAREVIVCGLGALQPVAVRNLRLRLKLLDFCDAVEPLGKHLAVSDGAWLQYSIDDLLAGEDRTLCFNLRVPELPCIDNQPVASLENEALLEMEILYDEVSAQGIQSKTYRQTIHALAAQAMGTTTFSDAESESPK
jgi:hypothetical protein